MKHVLFIAHSPLLRGAETVGLRTIRELQNSGCCVTVVMPKQTSHIKDFESQLSNIKILHLRYYAAGGNFMRMLLACIANIPTLFTLLLFVRKQHITTIYSNTAITILGVQLARIARLPHIWHFHEPVKHLFYNPQQRLFYEHFISYKQNTTIFIAQQQLEQWQQYIGKEFKSVVIYNPVKSIMPSNRNNGSTAITFGFIGSLDKPKNVDLLISTFMTLQERYAGISLLICGVDKPTNEIYDGKLTNISFMPFTTDVESFYGKIDVLVIPSESEVMPLVVIEAMMANVCVVQTTNSFMGELFDTTQTIFCPPDSALLLQAMQKMLNPELRQQLRQNANMKLKTYDFNGNFTKQINQLFS